MNSEKVQTIINEIISDLHARIGGKAARKQYPVAKHQIETLTELGIIELMPKGFGHADAKAVIEEAQRSSTAVMNAYGEGEEIGSSKLYQALNEVEIIVEKTVEQNFGSEYEIEIYGMELDTDMGTVQQELYDAGITGDDRDDIGIYLRDNKSRSIFVSPADVNKAVSIINSLGFQTDEDVYEDA